MHFKSDLEKQVYKALTATGTFTSGFFCTKEESWNKIFPNISRTQNAVDFYYPQLNLIIEVQGEQHYIPVGFGEKDDNIVMSNFRHQRKRDKELKILCEQNNVALLEIHYNFIRTKTEEELASSLEELILDLIGD